MSVTLLLGMLLCILLPGGPLGVHGVTEIVATGELIQDRAASFGPWLDGSGVTGGLVPLLAFANEGGCDISELPEYINGTWVALVQQSTLCDFESQVRNMQTMGAIAVIVGSNTAGAPLVTMEPTSLDPSNITVSAVFVTFEDYTKLVQRSSDALASFPAFKVRIYFYQTSYWPLVNIIIVRVVAPAIIMIFLYSLAFRFRSRQRIRRECANVTLLKDVHTTETPPQESLVKDLPTRTYAAKTGLLGSIQQADEDLERQEEEPDTCSICLEEYLVGDELRILPCKHEFHTSCIDQWLTTRKRFCPLCKQDACPVEESPLV